MRRRKYLTGMTVLAPLLAGCLGDSDGGAADTETSGTDEQNGDSDGTGDSTDSSTSGNEDSPVLSPAGKIPTGEEVTFEVEMEVDAGELVSITVENTFMTSESVDRFEETDVLEVPEDGVLTVTYEIPDDLPDDEVIRIRVEEADSDGGILVNERREVE